MSEIPSLPSYEDITDALKKNKLGHHASQIHGLICGVICGTSEQNADNWKRLVFEGKKSKSIDVFQNLQDVSYQQMNEFSFEFSLLLPDEEIDINPRAEALGLWCQGFLTGLEQVKIPLVNRSPSEITEAINDIIEISQVNYGDIVDDDEDETAYFELVEYVRLAVLMIFHDLRSNRTTRSESSSLH